MNRKNSSVFAQMTKVVESSSHLLIANANDFWEGDRSKIIQANPGAHLWIISQCHTDFFRLGSYPSQKTLHTVVRNALQTYGRRYCDFYRVEISRLNNHLHEKCDRPQGKITLLSPEDAIALIDKSFSFQNQQASA